jgi:hypothetical protein
MEGGMLWRNGCDGKVLRYGAGDRHQQVAEAAAVTEHERQRRRRPLHKAGGG